MNLLLAFPLSLLCALTAMPSAIRIAHAKRILDLPSPRKTHVHPVPLLGGLVVFFSFLLAFTFLSARYFESSGLFILTGLVLLFLMGLRDDIHPLEPGVKFSLQLTAAALAVLPGGIRITDFGGCFGITDVPFAVALPFSVLLIVFLTNTVNFIDGIDGLAGSLMLLLFIVHALLHFQSGDIFYSILSLSAAGALCGFLVYNLPTARIFMGDSGSVTVGYLAAVSTVRLCESSAVVETGNQVSSGIVLPFFLFLLPVADALRLIVLRISRGRSPFRADTSHIHHLLLQNGWSPLRVLLFLTGIQVILTSIGYALRDSDPTFLLPAALLGAIFLMTLFSRFSSTEKAV